MISKAGLVGVYQPPTPTNKGYTNAIYMVTDENTNTVLVFILFPGAYDDVYEIISNVWYTTVVLVPISLTSLYMSDVVRLSEDLTALSKNVRIIHPDKFPAYVPVATQKNYICYGRRTALTYSNGFIAYDFKADSEIYQHGFHDIFLSFGTRRCLFCPVSVNADRIYKMLSETLVDYVYVPYSDTYFGADSYLTLIKDERFEQYQDRLVAFGFHSQEEANYCRLRYPMSYPRTYRSAFLGSAISLDSCEEVVIGSSGLQTATNKFILEHQDPEVNNNLPIVNEDAFETKCECCTETVEVPIPQKPKTPFVKLEMPRKPKPFNMPEIPNGSMEIPETEVTETEPDTPDDNTEGDSGTDTDVSIPEVTEPEEVEGGATDEGTE